MIWIRNRIEVKGRIRNRLRIKETSRFRIRIKMTSRIQIQIRINMTRIRNTARESYGSGSRIRADPGTKFLKAVTLKTWISNLIQNVDPD
jgi:hypothetical protein